jgi:DNA-binding IclR family transcriptional regulator
MSPRTQNPSRDESSELEAVADPGTESRGVSVLQNGLAVLRAFTVEEPLLGVSEIAARVGLHKSTVSRILATLELEGLVERDPTSRRFRLGLGVIALAGPLLADLDVRRVAYPVMADLSRRTGETSALMVWDGGEAVCVEQVPSRHQVKHTTPLGARYNTCLSSSVQVFLASLDAFAVRTLIMSGSLDCAAADEEELDAYLSRLHEVRERGFAVNYGETSIDEVGVAAPVLDHRGQVVASVLVSAPRFRVSSEQLDMIAEAAGAAAREVTRRLGGTAEVGA